MASVDSLTINNYVHYAEKFEDLEFADDIALMPHTRSQIQDKLNIINKKSQQLSLNIHWGKTTIVRVI